MLWIFCALFLTIAVIGFIMDNDWSSIIGSSFFIIFFIPLLTCLACYNSTVSTADTRMKVLEEQNKIVLAQIEPIIENYMQYEKTTYEEFKLTPEKVVAFCSMYPELKSNTLVQKQIDVIMNNQEEIKKLKLEKASLNSYHLWLFTRTYDYL